jgi:hypothetical protein
MKAASDVGLGRLYPDLPLANLILDKRVSIGP